MKSLKNAFEAKKSQIFLQFLTVQIACLSLGYGLQRKKKCFSTFLNSISDCIEIFFKDFKALNNPITWKFSDLGRFCLMSNFESTVLVFSNLAFRLSNGFDKNNLGLPSSLVSKFGVKIKISSPHTTLVFWFFFQCF